MGTPKRTNSGLLYAIISLVLSAALPTIYGSYIALQAVQDLTNGNNFGEFSTLEEYLVDALTTNEGLLYTQLLLWVGMLSGPLLAAIRKVKLWLDDTKVLELGFKNKWIGLGILFGLGAQAVLLTLGALIQAAYPEGGIEGNASEIIQTFENLNLVMLFLMIALGAPIVEEIMYRGLVFTALSNKLGVISGAIISSLIFGMSHISSLSINGVFTGLITALFGGILVYARIKSKGLFLPIVMHITFNAVSALAIVAVSEFI